MAIVVALRTRVNWAFSSTPPAYTADALTADVFAVADAEGLDRFAIPTARAFLGRWVAT